MDTGIVGKDSLRHTVCPIVSSLIGTGILETLQLKKLMYSIVFFANITADVFLKEMLEQIWQSGLRLPATTHGQC